MGCEKIYYYHGNHFLLVSDDFWDIIRVIQPEFSDLEVDNIRERLLAATVTVGRGDKVEREEFPDFERNQMCVDEMKEFLAAVKSRRQNMLTLEEGVVSLRMACAAKKAAKDSAIVSLKEVQA